MDVDTNTTFMLKTMPYDALNNLHNRLRAKLGYDSPNPRDYDQLDPNEVALYNIVDCELCSRRQADPGKVAAMLTEALIDTYGAPKYNEDTMDPNEGNEPDESGEIE